MPPLAGGKSGVITRTRGRRISCARRSDRATVPMPGSATGPAVRSLPLRCSATIVRRKPRLDEAFPEDRPVRQLIQEERPQRIAQPMLSGNPKRRLGRCRCPRGESKSSARCAVAVCRGPLRWVAARHAVGELGQLRREVRGTDLDGVEHPSAIDLEQDIVGKPVSLIELDEGVGTKLARERHPRAARGSARLHLSPRGCGASDRTFAAATSTSCGS